MDRSPTRSRLETFSNQELLRTADALGLDIPPGLDRVFIIEELLDLAAEEDREEAPLEEAEFVETAPLPRQYNITFIDVLLRDPLWAFVFWEVKTHDRELHEGAPGFGGYLLRVSSSGGGDFTVPVGNEDTAWYLGFPPSFNEAAGGGRVKVELCVIRGDEALALAASHPFTLSKLLAAPGEAGGNPLVRLSGLDDFEVLRASDRLSRLPRRCNG